MQTGGLTTSDDQTVDLLGLLQERDEKDCWAQRTIYWLECLAIDLSSFLRWGELGGRFSAVVSVVGILVDGER
jgi:hypothetical protein